MPRARVRDTEVRIGIILSKVAHQAVVQLTEQLSLSQSVLIESLILMAADTNSKAGHDVREAIKAKAELANALSQARNIDPSTAKQIAALLKAAK